MHVAALCCGVGVHALLAAFASGRECIGVGGPRGALLASQVALNRGRLRRMPLAFFDELAVRVCIAGSAGEVAAGVRGPLLAVDGSRLPCMKTLRASGHAALVAGCL